MNEYNSNFDKLTKAKGYVKMSEVSIKVKEIVAEQLGVDLEKVTDTANFIDDLEADSLDTVELVMALEEEFGIEIPDEDAEKITAVNAAVEYVEKSLD